MLGISNPTRASFRRILRFVLPIIWCLLIFAASSRPDLRVSSDDQLDFVLRKLAHAMVFGILLVLLARLFRAEGIAPRASIIAALVATLAYAVSDEWHQTFVSGRVGHASDVAIDMAGALLAAALLHRRWRRYPAPQPTFPEPEQ